MRKTAKQIGEEARPRIDATKGLTLDQRIALLEQASQELGIVGKPKPEDSPKVANWLKEHGYEPMMFSAAANIILARFRQTSG